MYVCMCAVYLIHKHDFAFYTLQLHLNFSLEFHLTNTTYRVLKPVW